MKKLIIIILAFLLIFTFVACNKTKEVVDTNTPQATPRPTRKPLPTPTPLPPLKPDKILAQWNSIIKIYENGEYGYLGNHSIEDELEYYEDKYIERMIQKDTIKAKIPVIVDNSWDYDRIEADNHAVLMASNVDKADYDKKYGEKLKEIASKYDVGSASSNIRIKGYDKCHDNKVYLLETGVFAHFSYVDSRGDYLDYCNRDVFQGQNIVDVAVGKYHVVGATDSGKVLSYITDEEEIVAIESFAYGQEETEEWTDIVDVAAGDFHTIALKKDGTVVACGDNNFGQLDVTEWEDIVAVEAGSFSSFGIKSDGTVVVAGAEEGVDYKVGGWREIVELKTGANAVAALDSYGDVYVSGGSPERESLIWDVTGKPIFSNVMALDFIYDTIVVMHKNGEIDIASVYDYLFNIDDFTTDIDDIAAINTYSYGIKKGRLLRFSSTDKIKDSWTKILENEERYDVMSYIEQVVKFEINDDGDLLLKEQRNQKRQALFDYKEKLVDCIPLDIFGRYVVVTTETGDALFVGYDYNDLSFNHEVIFTSVEEDAAIKKVFCNRQVVALLDDKGLLHHPYITKLKLNSNFLDLDWDTKNNWDRDVDMIESTDTEIVELANWDEFSELFDGKLPEFKQGRADSFYKSEGKSSSTAGAWFHSCTMKEYESYIETLLKSGFEMEHEHESVITDADGKECPIVIKELVYKDTGAGIEVDITDYGDKMDVSLAFGIKN